MKSIVLDTNIIVSSALGGVLELILDKWAEDAFTVIVTSDILAEYFEVIIRPKFRLKQPLLTASPAIATSLPNLLFLKNVSILSMLIPKMINFLKLPLLVRRNILSPGTLTCLNSRNFGSPPFFQPVNFRLVGRVLNSRLARI